MFILYAFLLIAFSIYTYALVDPNITLLNNAAWTQFRNVMVQLGYYQRPASTAIFVIVVVLLFLTHRYFVKNYKKYNPMRIALVTAGMCLLAYPFLSHDLFNYIFDARIFTYYHQNPYLHTALDFPDDTMTRFMHWTHRTYPYGPSFLGMTLIPSFLSLGKFIVAYGLFKVLLAASYLYAVHILSKWNKEWAMFYATQPLVIVEGLVNSHNDIIAVSLCLVGLYYVFHKKETKGRIALIVSGLVKYSTLPFMIVKKDKKHILTRIGFAGMAAVMIYLVFVRIVQPWYFLNLLVFIPYYFETVKRYTYYGFFILLAYVGFLYSGEWNATYLYSIILAPLAVYILYDVAVLRRKK